MLKSKILLLGFAAAMTAMSADAATTVRIADRPDTTARSLNYVNSRAPLRQQSFIKLPVGSIKPAGWILRMLELQRDGLNGQLGEISAWLDKNNNAWLTKGGDHGWEEVPYWLKGYSDLAYVLGDKAMLDEVQTWIESTFASQDSTGFFGPENIRNNRRELWAQMIMLTTLQSYYEYTGDERALKLMSDYFKYELTIPDGEFLEDYWENSRGGDNLYTVLWLYNRTGDPQLLELAHKLHRNTADWCQATSLPNWHNVNIAECFREPATYYMLTGDPKHLNASYNVQQLIRRTFGQVPGGMFGGDENSRLGYIDPRQGVETCGMVEQMASDEIMLRFTGDPLWAENCEDVAFNSYPASMTPDLKALRYITSPNMVQSDSENHHPGIDNSGPFLSMNPFSSRCCQHNHGQGWPYYSENLVYATPDNGAAIVMYGASTATMKVADNKKIKLTQTTNYPFDDTVTITLDEGKAKFPLYLRIPSWTKDATVTVNGKPTEVAPVSGKYYVIDRDWKKGDKVTVTLPMHLGMRQWAVNQNSVSVDYGPLTLSLRIAEKNKLVNSAKTAIGDSRWQATADPSKWPTTEIYAASPWNYALYIDNENPLADIEVIRKPWPADNQPFTLESVPLEFKAKGRRVPSWTMDEYKLCSPLPTEDAPRSEVLEDITLVPMGAARLRISAFPQAH